MATSKKNNKNSDCGIKKEEESKSSIEEVIYRSHRHIMIDINKPLEKKSHDQDILKQLLDIELKIFKKARAKGII
jgi:hypothetical protein